MSSTLPLTVSRRTFASVVLDKSNALLADGLDVAFFGIRFGITLEKFYSSSKRDITYKGSPKVLLQASASEISDWRAGWILEGVNFGDLVTEDWSFFDGVKATFFAGELFGESLALFFKIDLTFGVLNTFMKLAPVQKNFIKDESGTRDTYVFAFLVIVGLVSCLVAGMNQLDLNDSLALCGRI